MKTHYITATREYPACGRSGKVRMSTEISRVTCGHCQKQPEFMSAAVVAEAEAEARFAAQTPTTVRPQFAQRNADGNMECTGCGGVLFREKPRNTWCFNYVCADENCGRTMSPLTETGMCT